MIEHFSLKRKRSLNFSLELLLSKDRKTSLGRLTWSINENFQLTNLCILYIQINSLCVCEQFISFFSSPLRPLFYSIS